jgi:hypothetical protein
MQNPRQLYGLGSLVKKITRPLKKVFKSPIGKAAMLGLGAYGLGGGFGAGGFKFGNMGSGLGSLFSKGKNLLMGTPWQKGPQSGVSGGLWGGLKDMFGKGSIGKGAMALGLGGGLASMFAQKPDEDEEEYVDRIRTLKPYLKKYYKNANPTASDDDLEEFLTTNLSEYGEGGAKDGGLIGYAEGGEVDEAEIEDQETITEDVPTPTGMEKLQETLTEVAKVLYRATPVGAAMFTYDEAKKIYDGLPDISKEMIHRIGKAVGMMTPIGMASAGAKGLATLLKGGMEEGEAQDMLGYREKVTRKKDKDPVGDLIDQGASFEEAVDITTRQGAAKGGSAKKKKKKYKRQGMEFDYPLGPEGTFNLGNPPVRYEVAKGGLMDLGGYEKDYRMGGFVPLGKKEKADDVPARLSKNEFVFTADAVKAAGGGSVDKGAQKMYDTMKRLENRVA